jgi:hypothetical protein
MLAPVSEGQTPSVINGHTVSLDATNKLLPFKSYDKTIKDDVSFMLLNTRLILPMD